MEIQTGPIPPEAPIVSVDEDALVSQVLEIIGGIATEALTTMEEPQEGQGEGDDSVFLSDEDQDGRDVKTEAVCSLSEEQPADGAEETEAEEENSEAQQQHFSLGDDKQLQDLQTAKAEDQSVAAEQEQVEAELQNSAEPGKFWSISSLARISHISLNSHPNVDPCNRHNRLAFHLRNSRLVTRNHQNFHGHGAEWVKCKLL